MPTTSWIQETAEDRYWESRHAVERWVRRPPTYPCAICGKTFETADARSWHGSEAHPLARPMLYVGDRAAPSRVTVRTALVPADVTVGSATSVTAVLDGSRQEGLRPEELGELIASRRVAHLVLELENHRAEDAADIRATYVLEIAVPEPHDLAEVDQAFVRRLAVDRPSSRLVEAFASDVGRFASARAYAGALASYVQGVLIKEGSEYGGATLPFEAFQGKLSQAVVELREHVDRPVAASVVAAARLNLNDLAGPLARSGDPRLDACLQTLHDLVTGGSAAATIASPEGFAVPLCPIDRDTHLVLTAYETVASGGEGAMLEDLEGRMDDPALSPQDRAKLRVLLARSSLGRGRHEASVRHLETLRHDAVFQHWAERELETAS